MMSATAYAENLNINRKKYKKLLDDALTNILISFNKELKSEFKISKSTLTAYVIERDSSFRMNDYFFDYCYNCIIDAGYKVTKFNALHYQDEDSLNIKI